MSWRVHTALDHCNPLALDLVSVEGFLSWACSPITEHILKEWDGATSSEKKVAGLDSLSLAWWGEPATASMVQLGLRSCLAVYTGHWLGVRALKTAEWVKLLSCVRLFATPWTVYYQAPPSMGFSRQEYWSGLPFPSPGDLPDPGIEPRSPALLADALLSELPGKSLRHLLSFKTCLHDLLFELGQGI